MTTPDVESATVYGRADETIGTISSLKVGTDGKITEAVVDLGGFLGLGAYSVLMPLNDLTFLRETNGSDIRVYLDTTKNKLRTTLVFSAFLSPQPAPASPGACVTSKSDETNLDQDVLTASR